MCGICGIYRSEADPALPAAVRRMTAALTHRGPDQEGYLFDGQAGLGSRRLSILDPAGGRQPIADERQRYWVILNGEIYNFRDLRAELEDRHRFRTRTDTEVLVHLYEERGEAFVEGLNGMFALALWDRRERTLVLARDRIGIKPLYYYEAPGRFLFASEIKALLASGWVEPEVADDALYDFLRLKFVPGPGTIFRGVRRVEPGTVLRVDPGGTRHRRYWTLPGAGPISRRRREAVAEIGGLLLDSVRRQVVADVPIGLLLSGGVDSSALLALLHRVLGPGVRTFTVGFPRAAGCDETAPARRVARRFEADHHEIRAEPEDLPSLLFRLAWHLDEPIADPAVFPTYLVCRYARGEGKVALCGEGADELFAGYNKYRKDRWLSRLRSLPGPLRAAGLRLAALRGGGRRRDGIRRRAEMPAGPGRMLDWSAMFRPAELEDLTGGAFGPLQEERLQANLRAIGAGDGDGTDPLDAALRFDLRTALADSLLMKVDKASMAASLEVRVPYLDHRLVEAAVALPSGWKIRRGDTKWILKRAAREWLPGFVRRRPKHGFDVPVSAWLRDGLRGTARACLGPESAAERRFFRPGTLGALLDRHLAGEDHGDRLWGLLVLEAWFRTFVEPRGEARGSALSP
ncbi:MAG: asparagine synthase (glutamine-hydrolyzing) [Acidobacteria bacterium]|nr:asparagine synthase (glutamine-hydrolyzing) [Acidobacteriota bacterium]